MKLQSGNVAKASAVALACGLCFAGSAFGKAVPAGMVTFDGGRCTAKFVRSASDIVNETKRECDGDQNPWVDADVVLQFRPLAAGSKPNPTCDPSGLVTSFQWSNTEESLAAYQPIGAPYNVCVYLEDAVVASGTLDSADFDGEMTGAVPLAGRYQLCVSGTWSNRGGTDLVDAEYVSQDSWATSSNGLPPADPFSAQLGPNWGDVQVNGAFVNWGAYSTAHKYCTNVTLADGAPVMLGVFDGDATGPIAGWYGDNVGMLDYTLRYVGP